jgi:hypothetical protein
LKRDPFRKFLGFQRGIYLFGKGFQTPQQIGDFNETTPQIMVDNVSCSFALGCFMDSHPISGVDHLHFNEIAKRKRRITVSYLHIFACIVPPQRHLAVVNALDFEANADVKNQEPWTVYDLPRPQNPQNACGAVKFLS